MEPLLQATLSKTYSIGWKETLPVLERVSFHVAPGERIGIIGDSGSGKSTLLRCLVGLESFRGSVRWWDQPLAQAKKKRGFRSQVQLLLQDPMTLFNPSISLSQAFLETLRIHCPDDSPEKTKTKIQWGLSSVGGKPPETLPSELSGGEQRRAALVRVLLANPQCLLLDEPTTGLDSDLKWEWIQWLKREFSTDKSLLLTSHDLGVVRACCHRVIALDQGSLIDAFPTDAWFAEERHPKVKKWVKEWGLFENSKKA